jgi:hypothetical protein
MENSLRVLHTQTAKTQNPLQAKQPKSNLPMKSAKNAATPWLSVQAKKAGLWGALPIQNAEISNPFLQE